METNRKVRALPRISRRKLVLTLAISLVAFTLWTPYGMVKSDEDRAIAEILAKSTRMTLRGNNVVMLGPTREIEDALFLTQPADISNPKGRIILAQVLTIRQSLRCTPLFILKDFILRGRMATHYWELTLHFPDPDQRTVVIRICGDLVCVKDSDSFFSHYGRIRGFRDANSSESVQLLFSSEPMLPSHGKTERATERAGVPGAIETDH